jgi:dTDP-4-dehydrorhamnose reductase
VASLFGSSGSRAKGGNFIESIVEQAKKESYLRVVSDTQISPTYSCDAARAIVQLAQRATSGIVHVTNSGLCTWHALAKKVTELCRLEVSVEPVSSAAFARKAARPRNSALSNAQATSVIGAPFPPWQDAVNRYLQRQGYIR